MNRHGLQAWQISLVITAVVVLVESAVHYLIKRGVQVVPTRPVRIGGLGLLMALAVVLFVVALGPSLADQLSSVAAAVSAVVALWLTYRSYQQQPKDEEGDGNVEGDGKPANRLDDR